MLCGDVVNIPTSDALHILEHVASVRDGGYNPRNVAWAIIFNNFCEWQVVDGTVQVYDPIRESVWGTIGYDDMGDVKITCKGLAGKSIELALLIKAGDTLPVHEQDINTAISLYLFNAQKYHIEVPDQIVETPIYDDDPE